ncbi:MAG TPA: potassium transporter TrkA [Planctomycetaceae bacterium]|nr:potassium transporter TrkA [Planctomycetaceae bacterium]
MAGVFSLLIALAVSLIVNRIATMALMFTGLSREAAKFQARSAFSGCGYTTSEAEGVVNHPVRRKIVMVLMLLGNIGVATVIASVMLSVTSASQTDASGRLITMGVLTGGLIVLWLLFSSRAVERQMNKVIAWALKRFTDLDARDYASLLQLSDGYAVSEMVVESKSWLADLTLAQLRLADEGVLVLGIHSKSSGFLGIPRASDRIQAGDTLILYGSLDQIHRIDRRRRGDTGDRDHAQSVVETIEATTTENTE